MIVQTVEEWLSLGHKKTICPTAFALGAQHSGENTMRDRTLIRQHYDQVEAEQLKKKHQMHPVYRRLSRAVESVVGATVRQVAGARWPLPLPVLSFLSLRFE